MQHQLPPESPCLVVQASWIKSGHLGHWEHKPSVETQACQPSTLEVEDNGSEIQGPLPLHRVRPAEGHPPSETSPAPDHPPYGHVTPPLWVLGLFFFSLVLPSGDVTSLGPIQRSVQELREPVTQDLRAATSSVAVTGLMEFKVLACPQLDNSMVCGQVTPGSSHSQLRGLTGPPSWAWRDLGKDSPAWVGGVNTADLLFSQVA